MNAIVAELRHLALPLSSLHIDPANARRHSPRNVGAIAASFAKFGQRKPVVVQRQGMIVRAGNGAVAAAQTLGWAEIAAVVVDEGDVAATAFAIADNRTSELGTWDEDALGQLLSALRQSDEIDHLVTGFTDDEIDRLVGPAAGLTDPDELPPAPAPVTQPGDLWQLGGHRLACGSSTDAALVTRALEGVQPKLLCTDPPYGVELDMEWRDRAGFNELGAAQSSYMRGEGHRNTAISGDTRADWSEAFALVPSLDTAYVWHASSFAIEVGQGLRRIGFELKQQIIWRKPHFALSRQHYHWQHEPCWYARRPGATPWRGSRDQSTVWDAASPKMLMTGSTEEKFDHPTQKPVALFTRPIENHTSAGDVVYEPFGGSGTTLIAAEQTRRRCVAIELEPKYCDVIVARWEAFTGERAVRTPA